MTVTFCSVVYTYIYIHVSRWDIDPKTACTSHVLFFYPHSDSRFQSSTVPRQRSRRSIHKSITRCNSGYFFTMLIINNLGIIILIVFDRKKKKNSKIISLLILIIVTTFNSIGGRYPLYWFRTTNHVIMPIKRFNKSND